MNIALHHGDHAELSAMLLIRALQLLSDFGPPSEGHELPEPPGGAESIVHADPIRLVDLGYQDLRRVAEAMIRMQSGAYGTCLDCGIPISLERLRSIPWTKFCLDCESIQADDQLPGPA